MSDQEEPQEYEALAAEEASKEAARAAFARRHGQADAGTGQAVQIGDIVRVGKGKKLWRVDGFWGADFRPMADLAPLDGYSRSSAELERLTIMPTDNK